jgi:hypothetical protein
MAREAGLSAATVSRAMRGMPVRGLTALCLVQAFRRRPPLPEAIDLVTLSEGSGMRLRSAWVVGRFYRLVGLELLGHTAQGLKHGLVSVIRWLLGHYYVAASALDDSDDLLMLPLWDLKFVQGLI